MEEPSLSHHLGKRPLCLQKKHILVTMMRGFAFAAEVHILQTSLISIISHKKKIGFLLHKKTLINLEDPIK